MDGGSKWAKGPFSLQERGGGRAEEEGGARGEP